MTFMDIGYSNNKGQQPSEFQPKSRWRTQNFPGTFLQRESMLESIQARSHQSARTLRQTDGFIQCPGLISELMERTIHRCCGPRRT